MQMELWNKQATGTLCVALIYGIVGGVLTLIAIQIYKRWGWSLIGSNVLVSAALLAAVSPLTWRIHRKYWKNNTPSDSPK